MYWKEINPQQHQVPFKFDDQNLKKDKNKILMQLKINIINFVQSFFSSSNIHGFNHLTAERRHYTEKFIWAIAICLSIYGSIILSSSTWTRYQVNPTVISMDRDYKEWATTHPAITLCPTYKVNDQQFNELLQYNFTNYSDSETDDLRAFFESLANATYGTFNNVLVDNKISPKDYLYYIRFLRDNITYVINAEITSLNKLVPTITELGLCYTYNGEIAPYNDYEYWSQQNTSKLPSVGVLSSTPLDGDIFVQMSMDFGYIGFLHSPYEVPDVASHTFASPEDFYKTLYVTALSIYSAPELKLLTAKQRGCMFMYESNLDISPIYTYNMCRNQCRMDQAKKLCGCVPYFYKPLKHYKICDVNGMYCLDRYKDFLINLRNTTGDDVKVNCGCYPPCDDVNYIIEGDNTIDWYLGTVLKWGLIKYPRMRLKRNVLFGFTDVLVSIGGTAGLFLGCSVLSFLEIIYFFTFRLVFNSSYEK